MTEAPGLLRAKVHARAAEDRLIVKNRDAYEIWVRAKPERGQANAAALGLLARTLGVEAKRLRIIKGAASPNKVVMILGSSPKG